MGVLLLAGFAPGAVLTLLTKVAFFFASWGDGPGLFTYGRGSCAGTGGFADGATGLTACGFAAGGWGGSFEPIRSIGCGWAGFAGCFGLFWASIQALTFELTGDGDRGCCIFS